MDKKFTVLRIVGTVLKVMAWLELIIGILVSVGVLLMGILGGPMLPTHIPVPSRSSWAYSIVGGIIGFVGVLIATILYFLLLYAAGELLYLLLAIEENTRQTAQQMQWAVQEAPVAEPIYAPTSASFSPPPPRPDAEPE
jgi:hypothetical protein